LRGSALPSRRVGFGWLDREEGGEKRSEPRSASGRNKPEAHRAEQTAEVVRNHEGGTSPGAWQHTGRTAAETRSGSGRAAGRSKAGHTRERIPGEADRRGSVRYDGRRSEDGAKSMRDASARSYERCGGVGCDETLKVSPVTGKARRVAAKANEPQLRPIWMETRGPCDTAVSSRALKGRRTPRELASPCASRETNCRRYLNL